MKAQIIKILAILCLVMGLTIYFGYKYTIHIKSSLKTAQNNFAQSQTDAKIWKSKYGVYVSEAKTYQLTVKQLKEYRSKDAEIIKQMGLKLKNINSIQSVVTNTEYKIITQVKDSIIRDTVMPCINYKDRFLYINGCIENKVFSGVVHTTDSVYTVPEIVYKGWFIFKRAVGVRMLTTNANPNATITFNEYVEIKH
jgi:hypothetical protein